MRLFPRIGMTDEEHRSFASAINTPTDRRRPPRRVTLDREEAIV